MNEHTIGSGRLELLLPLSEKRTISGERYIADAKGRAVQTSVAGCYSAIIYRANSLHTIVAKMDAEHAALLARVAELEAENTRLRGLLSDAKKIIFYWTPARREWIGQRAAGDGSMEATMMEGFDLIIAITEALAADESEVPE